MSSAIQVFGHIYSARQKVPSAIKPSTEQKIKSPRTESCRAVILAAQPFGYSVCGYVVKSYWTPRRGTSAQPTRCYWPPRSKTDSSGTNPIGCRTECSAIACRIENALCSAPFVSARDIECSAILVLGKPSRSFPALSSVWPCSAQHQLFQLGTLCVRPY